MGRIRMVTRTINNSICTVTRANLETATVENVQLNIGGGFTDEAEMLKFIKRTMDTATVKHLVITAVETVEEIWGMPETEFLKYASKLEKR